MGRRFALAAVVVAMIGACGDDAGTSSSTTTQATATTSGTTDAPASEPAASTTVPPGLDVGDHPRVVAHRGASGMAPENSIAAFELAAETGADFAELDVQLTADGVLVVLHDETLDRTARGPAEDCTGPVRSLPLDQVRTCDVGAWFSGSDDADFTGEPLPTLAEALAVGGDQMGWYIETKTVSGDDGAMEEALAETLDEAGFTAGSAAARRVLVQSFNPGSLERFHALRPDISLTLLLAGGVEPGPADLDRAAQLADGIGPNRADVDAELLAAAHERCLTVVPYTVNDPGEMTALLDLGVDGIITDHPEVLLPLVEDRDWSPPCR